MDISRAKAHVHDIKQDRSFTVTLFMPWAKFDSIKTEGDLVEFFEETFRDSIPLMGRELLVKEYFKNPKGSLIEVKVKPSANLFSLKFPFPTHSTIVPSLSLPGPGCYHRRCGSCDGAILRTGHELWNGRLSSS